MIALEHVESLISTSMNLYLSMLMPLSLDCQRQRTRYRNGEQTWEERKTDTERGADTTESILLITPLFKAKIPNWGPELQVPGLI